MVLRLRDPAGVRLVTMTTPNLSVSRTAYKLRLQVSSGFQPPAAGYLKHRSSEGRMSITRAKEIILDRIRVEAFLGHNAIAVYIAIADHSSKLNASPFRQALGTMQRHAFDGFILSLCKLYEKPNKRYPNYSIPTTLALLQKGRADISVGIQNRIRLERFIQARVDPNFAIRGTGDILRIPDLVLGYFSEHCPRTPTRDGYEMDRIHDALKVLRDKRVAHHEDADLSCLSKTDLDGSLRLLAFAQTYVNLVGYGFFAFSQESEVGADRFLPNMSAVWPEVNRMIELLEQPPAFYIAPRRK